MTPTDASARARATSKASIAASRRRAEKTARIAAVPYSSPNNSLCGTGSDGKKRGLALALQHDVEAVDGHPVGGRDRLRDQRAPHPLVGDRAQQRIVRVRAGLVGEVDPRRQPLEQTAREDR